MGLRVKHRHPAGICDEVISYMAFRQGTASAVPKSSVISGVSTPEVCVIVSWGIYEIA
jgi:hypothetical protein